MKEVLHMMTFLIALAPNAGAHRRPTGFHPSLVSIALNFDRPKYLSTSALLATTDSSDPARIGANIVFVLLDMMHSSHFHLILMHHHSLVEVASTHHHNKRVLHPTPYLVHDQRTEMLIPSLQDQNRKSYVYVSKLVSSLKG